MKAYGLTLLLLLFQIPAAQALETPLTFEDALKHLWQEEVKPTLTHSLDRTGQSILASGIAASIVAFQYDEQIIRHNDDVNKRWMSSESADFWGWIGNGSFGIGIALAQLYFDTGHGVQHAKAIALTSASHITLAMLTHRERPYKQNHLSFPSGHASSAFATSTSLAYAYGYKVGIPATLAAAVISFSRVNQNVHHLSDTIAGAALGIFWARASAQNTRHDLYSWMPYHDGQSSGILFQKEF